MFLQLDDSPYIIQALCCLQKSADRVKNRVLFLASCVAVGLAVISASTGQSPMDPLAVTAIAEVEQVSQEHGRDATKLVAADRVVSGDAVIYTLEIRNVGAATVRKPVVTYAVPEHMIYLADSAVGPGTEVSYSIDSGHSFDAPEKLKITEPNGEWRLAKAVDYTHIRWQLNHALKANSVAFVRFRARVK
jgi:uncharacterized repeat protein (TIGR01451 family)